MAETLDTLGEKIAALTTSVGEVRKTLDAHDRRFDQIDKRFDQVDTRFEQVDRRIDQQGSSLRTLIEAVDAKVDLVLEKVTHLMQRDLYNTAGHARFETRLDNHELRLIALESAHRPPLDSPDAGKRGGS